MGATLFCCGSVRQKHSQPEILLLLNGKTKIVQIASGRTAEAIMFDEFDEIAGVGGVTVSREGNLFSVDLDMLMFDRATRRRVYAKERKLYSEFPQYSFDVHLNDRSNASALVNGIEE